MKTSAASRLRRLALAALAAGTLAAPSARAALALTDQSNLSGTSALNVVSSTSARVNILGQSFTPALASMNAATFSLEDYYTSAPATVTLNVYAGAGFTGTLLGTSAPATFSNATSFATVEFDLPGTVVLTPGNTYTLALTTAANSGVTVQISGDAYPGGIFYYANGPYSGYDAVFAEGTAAPSTGVPEPSAWALVGLGAGALAVAAGRGRARA